MRFQLWQLLPLALGLSSPLAAQIPNPTETRTYFDVDGDGNPDFSLVRSWASFQYPFSFPDSVRPEYAIARWYLEPLGTTQLVQFDAGVAPGTVVRATDGEGQARVSSLLLLDAEWQKWASPLHPGPGNFTMGPVVDAQVRGLKSYDFGLRLGTNTPPRTGWVRIPTGHFPYTTNWPKEWMGNISAPFSEVWVSESKLAPGTNTSIRVGSPAAMGLSLKRRTNSLLVEIPDAAAASRLESATLPNGPWSPAGSDWDLKVSVPVDGSAGGPQARYYRVRPQ